LPDERLTLGLLIVTSMIPAAGTGAGPAGSRPDGGPSVCVAAPAA